MANGAAELFSFVIGKLEVLHEGLSGLYGNRAAVSKDEGDSDDVVVVVCSCPVGFGECLGELCMLLCFESLGGFQAKVTAKAYFQEKKFGGALFISYGAGGVDVEAQVIVRLWYGEEDVRSEDVLFTLEFWG